MDLVPLPLSKKYACKKPSKAAMAEIPRVFGPDGFSMPIVGFGTWQAQPEELEEALEKALEAGYRHIDTAYAYLNEQSIGKVLQRWISEGKMKREDIFIVSKLPPIANRPEDIEKFLDLSLQYLQVDFVNLYLIHTPFGLQNRSDTEMFPKTPEGLVDLDLDTDLVAIWKKLEEMVDKGKVRSLGVSNFNLKQVDRIRDIARIPLANNQFQLHVYLQRPELVEAMKERGIVVTSYSTLGTSGTGQLLEAFGSERKIPILLKDPVVLKISEEVGKSPAQVVLRHMLQKDIVVIPKSINPERIKENIDLFDFSLTDDQMTELDGLDVNSLIFDFNDVIKGIDEHPEYSLHGIKSING